MHSITDQPHDAHQAYLEFYRPAVHIMRTLNEVGKLTGLQQKFFAKNKESEELFDIVNDPFEMNNLIDNAEYAEVANEMRGHYKDWNFKNKDHGLDPINWENAPPPNAPENH